MDKSKFPNAIDRELDLGKGSLLLKKKDTSISEFYIDLANYIRHLHPTLNVGYDNHNLLKYNPSSNAILEDYKSLLHFKMLKTIPDFSYMLDNSPEIIEGIFTKYGLEEPSRMVSNKISMDLNQLVSKRLEGANKSIPSR